MPLEIVRNDITKMEVDAIVNAASYSLKQGGGVCDAIFSAAGAAELQSECDRIGHCGVGSAVMTAGFALPAKYIIHTAGPVWQGGGHHERKLLAGCYASALALAHENGLKSIAFPLISSGTFGYPKDKALQTAISAIGEFLLEHDMTVYLVVYDKTAYSLSDKLFNSIRSYIDDNYVDDRWRERANRTREINYQIKEMDEYRDISNQVQAPSSAYVVKQTSLEDILAHKDETFSEMLFALIDRQGKKDSEIYKLANIDRKLFSKIRSKKNYKPSRNTALALAIALQLDLDETRDLIGKAGFALSRSSEADLIVEYFIKKRNYNIFEINQALFAFGESCLGA